MRMSNGKEKRHLKLQIWTLTQKLKLHKEFPNPNTKPILRKVFTRMLPCPPRARISRNTQRTNLMLAP